MNSPIDLKGVNIEELMKNSKQVQNKLRQTIETLNFPLAGSNENEDVQPVWDSVNLGTYVRNIVENHIKSNSPVKQAHGCRTVESTCRANLITTRREKTSTDVDSLARSVVRLPKSHSDKALRSKLTHKPTVDGGNKQQEIKPVVSKSSRTVSSINSKGETTANTRQLVPQRKETLAKGTPRKRELPLQRFVGSSQETIDFSREHPDFGLYTTPKQITVFPRRFHKNQTNRPDQSIDDSINLAVASVTKSTISKPPASTPYLLNVLERNKGDVKRSKEVHVQTETKTWEEVFLDNKSTEKPKRMTNQAPPKKTQAAERERPIDIISNPVDGLYKLEKDGAQLSKRELCSFKRFPVMYIRPECRVQRVAKISIQADTCVHQDGGALKGNPPNVGYIECKHEGSTADEKETSNALTQQQQSPLLEAKEPKPTEDVRPSNKFIAAVQCQEPSTHKPEGSCSPFGIRKMSSKTTTTNSSSSSISTTETLESQMEELMKKILTCTAQQTPKPVQISVGTQFSTNEMSVQTDSIRTQSECEVSANLMRVTSKIPLLSLSKVTIQSMGRSYESETPSTTVNSVKSHESHDFCGELFEQTRQGSSSKWERRKESSETESFNVKERVKRRRKKRVLPKALQPNRQTECLETRQPPKPQPAKEEFEQPSNSNSMEKEVKRAVKIFLTSLAAEVYDCNEGRNRTMNLANSEKLPMNRRKILNYESASSSEEAFDLNGISSLSICSLSSTDVESHLTGRSISNQVKSISDSHSEGEVLSVGEV